DPAVVHVYYEKVPAGISCQTMRGVEFGAVGRSIPDTYLMVPGKGGDDGIGIDLPDHIVHCVCHVQVARGIEGDLAGIKELSRGSRPFLMGGGAVAGQGADLSSGLYFFYYMRAGVGKVDVAGRIDGQTTRQPDQGGISPGAGKGGHDTVFCDLPDEVVTRVG